MLDHAALQAGHVDREEGPGHQDQGVQGQDTRLHTPQPGDHDLSGNKVC